MEIEHWDIVRMELKYCERCGALWLRQRGTGSVYCAACSLETSDFSLGGRKINWPRLPMNMKIEIENRDGTVQAMVCDGRMDA